MSTCDEESEPCVTDTEIEMMHTDGRKCSETARLSSGFITVSFYLSRFLPGLGRILTCIMT